MDKHESELVALFSFSERTLHILTCKTFFFFKSTTLRAHPLLLFLESSWIEIYLPLFSLSLSKALECTRASFFFCFSSLKINICVYFTSTRIFQRDDQPKSVFLPLCLSASLQSFFFLKYACVLFCELQLSSLFFLHLYFVFLSQLFIPLK